MKKFRGVDFYEADALLTEEERLVRQTVREFVDAEVLPVMRDAWEKGEFPRGLIPKIAQLGLLGATLQGYGCAGMGPVAYGLALQELERGDSGVRSFASVQSGLVMYPIHAFGSDAQKERYLPRLQRADLIGCFGLTEPDFGSNPAGLQTRAVRKGDRWILNGTKMWITNANLADLAVVWARAEDGTIQGFLVERGARGFSTQEIRGKLSLRASDTGEILLRDCEVPEENRLPNTQGLKSALSCLNQARYGIAWGAVGAAMGCYEEALDYARQRVQFTRPIAGYQLVQRKLVEMLTEITKAQLLCVQLGRLKERGRATFVQVSLAKRNNVHHALEIARMARDILGANGILNEYSAMRHMCNLETVYTYEGTHDIHTLIVGEHITGLAAYY
ncbi:MAG TPA: acyl-CoA dehydrogenase family protein [Planctomycetota bacterium]|nr:acyl-CoA dehydrogenase family protein [Planctomycetota bacterium]